MATTIRFEPEIQNRLIHLAEATGRTKTQKALQKIFLAKIPNTSFAHLTLWG